MPDKFMVFDVESIGLHGGAFAVAWIVLNSDGRHLDERCLSCDLDQVHGTDEGRLWVAEHVPALKVTNPSPQHMCNQFWLSWRYWSARGAVLVADCAWPVETNFLSFCVALNLPARERQGPYPLYDLESMLYMLGEDPTATSPRLTGELPEHHPLMDARHSARQLLQCLEKRGNK